MSEPTVNSEVTPSLVFGERASNVKTFPSTRPSSGKDGLTNFDEGIPQEYSVGGSPSLKARIDDVNAIGRLASGFNHYRQCGGIVTYNPKVAELIGGYPKDAVLEYWDGEHFRHVASLMEDNLYNFVENPQYIDGIHWVYADSWGSPYGIYVDPSRVSKTEALSGGTENADLGWANDNSAYQYVADAGASGFFGKLSLRKSKWIRIEYDSFVILTSTKTADLTGQDNILYYVYTGYRTKDSSGHLNTFPMTIDAAGSVTDGSVYPISGDVQYIGADTSAVAYETHAVSTCLYMRAGSFFQLVYSAVLRPKFNLSFQVVRLMR